MIRDTSIEAYNTIKAEGLLSKRRLEVYEVLFHNGPLTATQIAQDMPGFKSQSVGANVHARLGELRSAGCVIERGEVECPITKMRVILFDVTSKLPIKLEKPVRHKCPHCKGKGYIEETQSKFNI